jgi:hypothetical protein
VKKHRLKVFEVPKEAVGPKRKETTPKQRKLLNV